MNKSQIKIYSLMNYFINIFAREECYCNKMYGINLHIFVVNMALNYFVLILLFN